VDRFDTRLIPRSFSCGLCVNWAYTHKRVSGRCQVKKRKTQKLSHVQEASFFAWHFCLCVIWAYTHKRVSGRCHGVKKKKKKSHTFLRLPCCMKFLFYTLVKVSERSQGMGWLRLVGSLKVKVSNAKEPYKRDDIMQKRPIILRSLLIVATPYTQNKKQVK